MNDAGMPIKDLAAELGLYVLTVEKAFRMFNINQLAVADPDDLALNLGGQQTVPARKIVAYARLKTGSVAKAKPAGDAVSVAILYRLFLDAWEAWKGKGISEETLISIGEVGIWVQVTDIGFYLSKLPSKDPNCSRLEVTSTATLVQFLASQMEYRNLPLMGLFEAMIEYVNTYRE